MNATLAQIAVKSLALLGAAVVLGWMLRKKSAAARHLAWTAALAGLLALPFLSVSLPSMHFAPAEKMLAPVVTFTADATARADITPTPPTRAGRVNPARTPRSFTNIFAILWAIGATLGCARMVLACAAVMRLRSRSSVAAGSEMTQLAREIGLRRAVDLRETSAGSMPMTAGLRRPTIFLPASASQWSAEKRRAVLLHELAHVRRGDVATQILARLAVSLYWWNPLAWFAWREFLKMRERAADDLVLELGASATEYARHLLDVARSTAAPAPAALAAIAMAQPSQLETRLAAILDSRISRKTPGRFAIALSAVAAAAIVTPLAAIHAQDTTPPADVENTIRVATSQNNFEMLDRAAEGFIKNRQYDAAQKMLEASLQVRAGVAGKQSPTYADGLVKLGDLNWEHLTSQGAGAAGTATERSRDYYEQAVALGDRPETAQALLRLGIFNIKDASKAEPYIQRSINTGAKGDVYGEALAWMAEIRDQQKNTAEAESLFARAQSAVEDGSAEQALVREMYAAFLTSHGRKDEAQPIEAQAAAFRVRDIADLSPTALDGADAKKIGGRIVSPGVQKKVEPGYNREAAALKVQGTVTLRCVIGPDGKAGNITLVRGVGFGLDERAMDAVSRWTFTPGLADGTPVPVLATIEVNFRLL
ncbi:MAG TPA: M56 family metallopeptidase [Bryobacteraceae bacterium]|nr:M56 family metallopeptidase [Bryobacteraceae bacterium]